MKKNIIFLILALSVFSCKAKETKYNLWYLSNAQAGNGDATSWANAMNMKDFTSSWYSSRVQPGDTVFIDGGTSGLTYTWANNGNGQSYATFYWNRSGTANDKIVITRGRDAGHNGQPNIHSASIGAIYANAVQYVEFSYLKMTSENLSGSYTYNACFRNQGCDNIDIIYNEMDYSKARGIHGGGTATNYTSNVKILHNYIYTDTVTVGVNFDYQNDAIKVDWASNLEIGYNVIINRAAINGYDGDYAHRDFFQLTGSGFDGSTTKIHHNFVGSIMNESVDIGTDANSSILIQGVYSEPWGGRFYIYDNVFAYYHNRGDITNLGDTYATNPSFRSLYMYNNTIVHTITHNYQGQVFAQDADTVVYKNNLYYSEQGDIFSGFTMSALSHYDIDYNQYVVPSITSFEGGLSFTSWKSTYSVDANSEAYVLTDAGRFTLVDNNFTTPSETETDYALVPTSSGVNEGFSLASLSGILGSSITMDYQDSLWNDWDMGAFEK